MKCTVCGAEIKDNSKFCYKCGAELSEQKQEDARSAPAAITAEKKMGFVDTGLGIIVLGAIMIFGLILLFASGIGGSMNMLQNIFIQILFYFVLAMPAVLSIRARGIDLSVGSVMAMSAFIIGSISANGGSLFVGIIAALAAAVFIGMLNGVLVTYLKVPAALMTLVTGSLAYAFSLLLTDGIPIQLDMPIAISPLLLIVLIALFAVGGVFVFIMFSPLGKPFAKRDDKKSFVYVLAYAISSAIAAMLGLYMLIRLRAAMPGLGSGYEIDLIFIAAAVYATRAADNRFAPALYALAPAFCIAVISTGANIAGWTSFAQMILFAILSIIMLAVAFACRADLRRAIKARSLYI